MPENNQFVCEGCHKQMSNQNELQQHQKNCPQYQAKKQGSGASQQTRGAGGSQTGGTGGNA